MPAPGTLAKPITRRPARRTWDTLTDLAQARPNNPVTELLLAAAPSVQRLSLHNQVALILQAGEHQLVLHDINTERGWARRGRRPRPGDPGLQIKRPHQPSDLDDVVVLYRTTRRWEFSQTEPADNGVRTQTDPAGAGDPAAFAEHLINQLGDLGYRLAAGARDGVDHDAQVITIAETTWNSDPVAVVRLLIPELAHALVNATRATDDA